MSGPLAGEYVLTATGLAASSADHLWPYLPIIPAIAAQHLSRKVFSPSGKRFGDWRANRHDRRVLAAAPSQENWSVMRGGLYRHSGGTGAIATLLYLSIAFGKLTINA